MSDPFVGQRPDLASQVYSRSFTITPGTAFAPNTRAIFLGAGNGTLTITTADDGQTQSFVFGSGWAGGVLPIRASAVAGTWTGGAIIGPY